MLKRGGTVYYRRALRGSIISIGAALLFSVLLIVFNAPSPSSALRAFFITPWASAWFLGNTLDSVALLLTASLGAALAFRGGSFNLGGEGQIYAGGLAASAVLLSLPGPALPALVLASLAAVLAGGSMGFVSGFLKRKFGANELITSFLLSSALSPAADYLITVPLRDPAGNLMATRRFAEDRLLPRLLSPSSLSLSFVFAVLLLILGYIFIEKSARGYRYRIAGAAPVFARYGGIEAERYWVPGLSASGAVHGLTGFFAVAGTYGICHLGFPGGMGWSAIAIALIARNRPLALLPAALVYGWLKAGSDAAALTAGLDVEASSFIQALILLLATVSFTGIPQLRRRRLP